MIHALSIDVEDWYHDGGVPVAAPEGRVECNTLRLLELLAAHGARATFFFLGDVAARHPSLVRRVAEAGHEVGSHGYSHRPVQALTRREFRDDVARSLHAIAEASGCAVRGYRAPYFSIHAGVRWPIDILRELGIQYDASVLAIDRPPGLELVCARRPFRQHNGLWEVPVAILRIAAFWYLPLASGGGLRFLPPRLLLRCIRQFEREVGAGVFYLHPWELDPHSPTMPGPGRWVLRVNRNRLVERLAALMQQIAFAPIIEVFAAELDAAAVSRPAAIATDTCT